MKSVVVLTPWFPNRFGDTAGAYVADSALAVARAGWRVGIVVVRPWLPRGLRRFAGEMVGGEIQAADFAPTELTTLRVPALPQLMLRSFTDILSDRMIRVSVERMARTVSADIIHVQTEGIPVAPQVARGLGLPLVVTLHGINTHPKFLHTPYQRDRIRSGLRAANRIVLVGEPLRAFFTDYVGSDKTFQIVPNGSDFPTTLPDRSIFAGRSRRLISVANLQEGKGIDLTLRALADLQRRGVSDWTYQIVGEGGERAALLKLAEELGLSGKITFVGAVRHADIFNHLAAADVFVLPSYREAFGIAYLEAMAAGLLTIGVAGQGPSQFIRNEETGILVPPRDVEALAAALGNILTGAADRWREVAWRGQQVVRSAYSWDHHAHRLVEVYENVIRGAAAEPRSPSSAQTDDPSVESA